MIFLTRVTTNPEEIARHRIADSYRWHQILWQAFPERDQQPRDFLTRVDYQDSVIIVWIVSPILPTPLSWGRWETKEVSDTFLTHKHYIFSLRANPTVMRVVRDEQGNKRKNGRRTAIYHIDELKEWLARRGNDCGFILDECRCEPPVKEVFHKGNQMGVHARVDFRGTLTVTDPQKFAEAYRNGIGPARAFGFGLFLLRPAM